MAAMSKIGGAIAAHNSSAAQPTTQMTAAKVKAAFDDALSKADAWLKARDFVVSSELYLGMESSRGNHFVKKFEGSLYQAEEEAKRFAGDANKLCETLGYQASIFVAENVRKDAKAHDTFWISALRS